MLYDVSVHLSVRLSAVTEVHWRIIANLSFKFRSQFTARCGRGLAVHAGASTELFIIAAMLTTARPSCKYCNLVV